VRLLLSIIFETYVWISQDSGVEDYVVDLEVGYHGYLGDEFLA
jgi:hypothetical protein